MSDAYETYVGIVFDSADLKKGEGVMEAAAKAGDRLDASVQAVAGSLDNASVKAAQAGSAFDKTNAEIEGMVGSTINADAALRGLGAAFQAIGNAQDKFLFSLQETSATLGMSQTELLRYKAAQLGVAEAAEASIRKIEAYHNALGMVGKGMQNTSGYASNLAFQMNDIGVSLASGMNPLMVFIQQGSQIGQIYSQAAAQGVKFSTVISGMVGQFGMLAAAVAPLAIGIAAVGGAFLLASREMEKGINSKALVAELDLTEKQMERLKEKGTDMSVTLGDSFGGLAKTVQETLGKAFDSVLGAMGTTQKKLGDDLGKLLDGVGKMLWDDFARLTAGIITIGQTVYDSVKAIFEAFAPLIDPVVDFVQGAFSKIFGSGKDAFDAIRTNATDNLAKILGLFGGLAKAIPALFGNLPRVLTDVFVSAFNAAGKAITDFVNKNRAIINAFISAAGTVLRIPIPQIPELKFSGIVNGAEGAMQSVADAFDAGSKLAVDRFKKNLASVNEGGSSFLKSWGENTGKAMQDRIRKDAGDAGAGKAANEAKKAAEKAAKEEAERIAKERKIAAKAMEEMQKSGEEWYRLMKRIADAERAEVANRQKLIDEAMAYAEGGRKALELIRETDDVIARNPEKYSEAFYGTAEAARKAAEEVAKLNIEARDTADNIARIGKGGIMDRFGDGLTSAFDRFFEDIPYKGLSAFKDLFTNLGDLLRDALGGALKAAFDPFVSKLKSALSDAVSKALGSFGKEGAEGTGLLGWLEKSVNKVFGSGTSGKMAAVFSKAVEAYGGMQIGSLLSSVLGGNKTSAQNKNSSIGGALGAAIGTIIPGIGTIIGSIIGSTLGGLVGPSSTNAAASSILDATGKSTSGILGTKRNDQTTGALNTAMTALQAGYKAIADLGGTMTTYVRNLEIGQRDQSRVDLSNGGTVRTAVGDAAAAANAGLIEVLKGTTFATASLNKIKDGMIAAGASFDDTYTTIAKVDAILKANEPALSEWAKALKDLDDTFKPLIATTGAYSSAVQEAYDTARAALATSFNQNIADQTAQLLTPMAKQFTDLIKTQADRIADATKIGASADMAAVLRLNDAELSKFLTTLASSGESIGDFNAELQKMVEAATAAGVATQPIIDALNKAKAGAATTFDTGISKQIDQLVNPTMASLKALLQQQKDRLKTATELGANVVAAERLNALETKQFFSNLTEEQKLSLGEYLGLIEDYTGKIGVVLAKLNDSLAEKIDRFAETKSKLEDTISIFGQIAKSLADTRSSLVDRYAPVTPLARINDLRSQFSDLTAKAAGGDQLAGQALPDLANKLIDLSRSLYGSTTSFFSDYEMVVKGLADAEAGAKTQVDVAQSQLDTLIKQYDMLTQIRDVLSSDDPNIAYLTSVVGQLDANNKAISDQIIQYLDLINRQAQSNFTASQITTAAQTSVTSQAGSSASVDSTLTTVLHDVQVTMDELVAETAASNNVATKAGDEQTKLLKDIKDLLTVLAKAA